MMVTQNSAPILKGGTGNSILWRLSEVSTRRQQSTSRLISSSRSTTMRILHHWLKCRSKFIYLRHLITSCGSRAWGFGVRNGFNGRRVSTSRELPGHGHIFGRLWSTLTSLCFVAEWPRTSEAVSILQLENSQLGGVILNNHAARIIPDHYAPFYF
ncbi:hypothetical protein BOTBODRAFT_213643 [Botryobasidium botryosum FD-172 SS1]|uniref:Uncharacterized protein n=1 Tax=Botryobasidium botryosum (strain FD-172 SS1) TaxID=930990 RepID=A0A067N1T6_BOTB1|nr:hypothetical protein BOTBODRAFT_213643 [Botryobasidium botryosum FD-172 SS1]